MNDRYLIIASSLYDELKHKVAEFLWNNGKEVIIKDSFNDDESYLSFLEEKPNIITINNSDFSLIKKNVKTEELEHKDVHIHFSANGVYTNLIPFPHKIFEFKTLNELELNYFFEWCKSQYLFIN